MPSDIALPSASPPGPSGAQTLYALRGLRTDPLGFMAHMARDFGPVARIHVGKERLVFISDPALIGEVLQKQSDNFIKDRITRKLTETLGNGLLTSEGESWRRHRKAIAPIFKRGQLEAWSAEMVRRTDLELDAWFAQPTDATGARRVELAPAWARVTLGIVFATVFGAAIDDVSAEVGVSLDAMMDQFELELRTWRRFVPQRWLRGGRRRMAEARAALDAIVYGLIAARRRRPLEDGDDLLGRLMLARDVDGTPLSDEELRDEAVTMFVAGHETTAIALAIACWRLGHHIQVRERLQHELDAVLGPPAADGSPSRAPTHADVAAMPYLRGVVLETLRMHPPAYVVGRTVQAPMELGGYRLDPGDSVLLSQWAMHHDPRYFPEPERFAPERWADGFEASLPKFVYFPFGGGPRVCVGNHFATLEMQLCLATFWRRCTLESLGPLRPPTHPSVTLRTASPLPVRVLAR